MGDASLTPFELDIYKQVFSLLSSKNVPNQLDNFDSFLAALENHQRESVDPSQFPDDIKSSLAELARERDALEEKIAADERAIETLEKSSESRDRAQLSKKLDRIREEIKELQAKQAQEASELTTLNEQVAALKNERAKAEETLKQEKESTAQLLASGEVENRELPEEDGPYEIIRYEDISNAKPIGKTWTGADVILAKRAGEKVLVKRFGSRREFDEEVAAVGQLHSGYVISMYGASTRAPDRITVSEHLEKGNLYSLLLSQEELPWDKRWSIACDICLGMWYLHSRYPPVMSREYLLTAYNVHVANDFRAKIAVSGLGVPAEASGRSREDFDKQFMPPELLRGGGAELYGEKADIYAYAVVLWLIAERKPFPWDGDELEKRILNEERPPISASVPEEFSKVIEWSWRPKPEARLTFRRIVKTFKTKGLLTNKQEARKEAASRMEDVVREIDIMKQLLDRLKQQYNQANRKFEREKQLTECCEQEVRAAESRFDLERKKVTDIEKKIADLERETEERRQNAENNEKKKKKDQKNLEMKQKRVQEELEQDKEQAEKKLDNEKRRGEMLRKQLEEAEQALEQERARRIEAEKRRDEYRARC